MAIIAVILVAAVALGAVAWVVTGLTSTGSITVKAPPPQPDYSYTVEPSDGILAFGVHEVTQNTYSEFAVPVTVTNTGNQPIGGFEVTPSGIPTGFEMVYAGYNIAIAPGDTGTITFILKGNCATTGTFSLSGMTFTLTPHEVGF